MSASSFPSCPGVQLTVTRFWLLARLIRALLQFLMVSEVILVFWRLFIVACESL